MNNLTHILTRFTISFSCFGLWALLNILRNLSVHSTQALPVFSMLLVVLVLGRLQNRTRQQIIRRLEGHLKDLIALG